jgi:hypothetical protein
MPKRERRPGKKNTCFVIMPFGTPFDDYYKEILVPAIRRADLLPVRADEINKPGVIINQIWKGIQDAIVCVADVSGRNANVMYELGLAHATAKPVVQLVQQADDLPFDLRAYRHIVYRTEQPRWAESLAKNLEKMLREAVADPESTQAIPVQVKRNAVSDREARDSALLIVLAPDEAARHMRSILAKAHRKCRGLRPEESHEAILSFADAELERVRLEANSESVPEKERDWNRYFLSAVASRMEAMLTEFTLRVAKNPDGDPLPIFLAIIEEWTPDMKGHPSKQQHS